MNQKTTDRIGTAMAVLSKSLTSSQDNALLTAIGRIAAALAIDDPAFDVKRFFAVCGETPDRAEEAVARVSWLGAPPPPFVPHQATPLDRVQP